MPGPPQRTHAYGQRPGGAVAARRGGGQAPRPGHTRGGLFAADKAGRRDAPKNLHRVSPAVNGKVNGRREAQHDARRRVTEAVPGSHVLYRDARASRVNVLGHHEISRARQTTPSAGTTAHVVDAVGAVAYGAWAIAVSGGINFRNRRPARRSARPVRYMRTPACGADGQARAGSRLRRAARCRGSPRRAASSAARGDAAHAPATREQAGVGRAFSGRTLAPLSAQV
eukprot:CAMPEP_0179928354 /NCGR_PEP_ID=MMETSP0983-20121128/8827_1 /TAXON_ID=483367 /ORGANISM="non described non described, Strain CCMP 2436" /LENGTH=226 /DNA_ID=CAMNT_0021832161 /DNA_START=62 /DNA_END=740 /DNA_ORIENTATION=-